MVLTQQCQSVKSTIPIDLDFIVKAIRLPGFRPVRYRYSLPETVQLQTTTTDGVHNRSVVHHLEGDTLLLGPDDEVGVSCGAKRISDNQQSNVQRSGTIENLIGTLLH